MSYKRKMVEELPDGTQRHTYTYVYPSLAEREPTPKKCPWCGNMVYIRFDPPDTPSRITGSVYLSREPRLTP